LLTDWNMLLAPLSNLCVNPQAEGWAAVSQAGTSPRSGGYQCRVFPYRIFFVFDLTANLVVIVHMLHDKREIADLLELAVREI